ncbi:hypothetical protein [Chelativorans intermedius]|uniref:Uncharacterized protein n=1 Tax=Chelativorans intermedius TaxID=515947 RepID=A0ABV6D6T3_9HYPH|nr:hypothetical protein [Chelativorans intermedius]MCT8998228.1 hypothetical protein [Chelativorans intermedius]
MFIELAKGLNERGAGVRAYDACARAARARMAGEPENAAALLLISYAAQLFVDAYDDQPLSVAAAGEEFEQFSKIVTTLEDAYGSGSAEAKVDALNRVAAMLVSARRG